MGQERLRIAAESSHRSAASCSAGLPNLMKILVLNGGSSTLKATLREVPAEGAPAAPPPLWEAQADWGRETGRGHPGAGRRGIR